MTKHINISTIIATIFATAFLTQNLMHLTQSPHRGVPSSPSTAGISREEIPAFLPEVRAGDGDNLPESRELNPEDKMFEILDLLRQGSKQGHKAAVYQYKTLIDFNGDGLTDFLYHYYNDGNGEKDYRVYLNSGNNFDMTYNCKQNGNNYHDRSKNSIYKGDCADPNSPL